MIPIDFGFSRSENVLKVSFCDGPLSVIHCQPMRACIRQHFYQISQEWSQGGPVPFFVWTILVVCISRSRCLKIGSHNAILKNQDELLWCPIVRRPSCVRQCVRPCNFFKQLLLWNHSLDFDHTSQKWSLGGPLPKLFKPFQLVA